MLVYFLTSCSKIEITDGTAVAGIRLGRSTASDVKKSVGLPDSIIHHGVYATVMVYKKKGLRFYYVTNDAEKSIFGITVTAPYKIKTADGIVLNSSTMLDVRNIYGKLDWQSTEGSDYWYSEHNGIKYAIIRDKTVPQYPLNEKIQISRPIVMFEMDNRYPTESKSSSQPNSMPLR